MTREPAPLDVDDLVRRYTAGETCQDLAGVYGVSETTLRRRLKARGVTIRQGPSYRTSDTMATREQRARTRERLQLHAGPQEAEFSRLLDEVGLHYVPQRAFGPYNVDLALVEAPIAVEVVSGSGNPRMRAGRTERIEYLLERGWWVVEVMHRVGRTPYPFDALAAEYLVTLAHEIGPEPAARGEHRVVRADGKPIAPRRRQVH